MIALRHRGSRQACGRRRQAVGWLFLGLLVNAFLSAPSEAQSIRKPPPPPGRDPGGLAIAILSTGIDYRDPETARLLARDGEGEIIAWDTIDNDNRPFAPRGPSPSTGMSGTDIAQLVGGPGRRIVPVRIAEDDPASIGRALAFVTRTPASIILMPTGIRIDWTTLVGPMAFTAARGLLLVVPTASGAQTGGEGLPMLRQMPGVILAADADSKGPADRDILYVSRGDPGSTVAGALAACWDRLAPLPDASGRKSAFLALVAAQMSGGRDGQCVPPTVMLRRQAR